MWQSLVTSSIVVILIVDSITLASGRECVPREFGSGNIVCVCNSTYCDSTARHVPEKGQWRSYESSKSGKRMSQKNGHFDEDTSNEDDDNPITLILNPDVKYQMIQGFGGAFTDSAGINIRKLSEESQNRIIETYFGADGSRYTIGRVPIGGTDFSTKPYTLDDNDNDVGLEKFSLAYEDVRYKIPMMQKARKINPDVRFLSAAWTAPPWMKTNNNYTGYGFLKKEYYQIYAEYLVKFLHEYKEQGLDIWAITTGNEPANAVSPVEVFNAMGWSPDTMAQWVADNLGPTIAASNSSETIILILDDQRFFLPQYAIDVFRYPTAKNYTTGIAVHWYFDRFILPQVLDETHDLYPDKFMLMTEGCAGSEPGEGPRVILGDWGRAQQYATGIMENLSHWITGFVDWNLALDKQGGPNWVNNFVDSAIIVNPESDEFFKQPIYYAIAHFSKFISRDSMRINVTSNGDLDNLAFLTPDDEIVVILHNKKNKTKTIVIRDPEQGSIATDISPNSIQTIIYRT